MANIPRSTDDNARSRRRSLKPPAGLPDNPRAAAVRRLWILLVAIGVVTVAFAARDLRADALPVANANEVAEDVAARADAGPNTGPDAELYAEQDAGLDAPAAADATLADDPDRAFAEAVWRMVAGGLRERRDEAETIADSGHPRAGRVLNALLEGRLWFDPRASEDAPVVVLTGGEFEPDLVEDAITGDVLLPDAVEGLRAVPVNNPLRNLLRDLAALADLEHPTAARRALAAQRLMSGSLNAEVVARLDERLAEETHARVLAHLERTRTLAQSFEDDPERRLDAVERLAGELATPVRNRLAQLAHADDDARVRDAAAEALVATERKVAFYRQMEHLFFGLSLGSVLLLAALGLAITFGVMGVINMAHGELIMIGAYTTWLIQVLMPEQLTAALLLAIPAAFVVSGLVGVAMERGVIQFLYGRPLETLLATFGISLILQQAVRSLFSPLNQAVASPAWLSGSVALNPVLSLTLNRIVILFFAVAVFLALVILLKRSTLGLKVRAVTQNRAMARALGVRSSWVDMTTFGLGAGIAGVAGVALAQLTNVGPNMGQSYIIDSFMVVVFGGVGNLWGTFVGAMGLGVLTKLLEPATGAVLAKVLVLVFIILFIQRRPRGLFPQKGRAAEA